MAPGPSIAGWFFWNFKMELDTYIEWSYLHGVRGGWIPTLDPASADLPRYPSSEGSPRGESPAPPRAEERGAARRGGTAERRKRGSRFHIQRVRKIP